MKGSKRLMIGLCVSAAGGSAVLSTGAGAHAAASPARAPAARAAAAASARGHKYPAVSIKAKLRGHRATVDVDARGLRNEYGYVLVDVTAKGTTPPVSGPQLRPVKYRAHRNVLAHVKVPRHGGPYTVRVYLLPPNKPYVNTVSIRGLEPAAQRTFR